ncbi:MAG: hypothetical protein ABI831_18455 [Betaproteobacteria bacterium]
MPQARTSAAHLRPLARVGVYAASARRAAGLGRAGRHRPRRRNRFVRFLHRNVAGFAGNIALGLLLALVPAFADSFGIPLDVRHVTLSTGSVTAAVAALGIGALATVSFLYAAIGIAGIGLLNLGVSFYLALQVALRARGVPGVEKRLLYRRLARVVLTRPRRLLWPDAAPLQPRAVES